MNDSIDVGGNVWTGGAVESFSKDWHESRDSWFAGVMSNILERLDDNHGEKAAEAPSFGRELDGRIRWAIVVVYGALIAGVVIWYRS